MDTKCKCKSNYLNEKIFISVKFPNKILLSEIHNYFGSSQLPNLNDFDRSGAIRKIEEN